MFSRVEIRVIVMFFTVDFGFVIRTQTKAL